MECLKCLHCLSGDLMLCNTCEFWSDKEALQAITKYVDRLSADIDTKSKYIQELEAQVAELKQSHGISTQN